MADQRPPTAEDAANPPNSNEANNSQEPSSSSPNHSFFPSPASPRMTLTRRHQRFHDHAEYLRNRFFDGNPDAKAEYTTHKSQRNNTWAAMDFRKAASTEDVSKTDVTIDTVSRSRILDPPPPSEVPSGKRLPNKLRRRRTAQTTTDEITDALVQSKPGSRPGPKKGPRLSLLVGVINSLKRRNRRRSDVKPGYFRPEAGEGEEQPGRASPADRLEMNIPSSAVSTPRSESRQERDEVLWQGADEMGIKMVDREGKGKEVAAAELSQPNPDSDGNRKPDTSQAAPGEAV